MNYKTNHFKEFIILLIFTLNILVVTTNFDTVGGDDAGGFAADLLRGLGLPMQDDSSKEKVPVPRLDDASIESFSNELNSFSATPNSKITETFSLPSWGGLGFALRKNITIDATKIPSSLNDFPVLINLTGDTDLFGVQQANGNDIMFTDSLGNILDFEIETFKPLEPSLTAWVKTDLSGTIDTTISMYFGNSTVSNQENPVGVWDSNYQAVFHLNDDPIGTVYDSTSNNYDGTSSGTMTSSAQIEGLLDGGIDFDGTDDLINIGDVNSNLWSGVTAQAWIFHDATGDDRIICKSPSGTTSEHIISLAVVTSGSDDILRVRLSTDGDGGSVAISSDSATTFTTGTWHHVAFTWDSTSERIYLYIDGSQDSNSYFKDGDSIDDSTLPVILANVNTGLDDRYYDGKMDEARLSNIARSADWITTEYNNQYLPSSFYLVGELEGGSIPTEDYVDILSDVDSSVDQGSHNLFSDLLATDSIYDTITEVPVLDAIKRGNSAQGQGGTTSLTVSHTLGYASGNNRLVVAAAGFEHNESVPLTIDSITYNGQPMIEIAEIKADSGFTASIAIYYILDTNLPSSTGSYNVMVTCSSDPFEDIWLSVIGYINVDQAIPDASDSDSALVSATMQSDMTAAEDGSLLVQAAFVGNTGAFTPQAGTTEVLTDEDTWSSSAVFNEKLVPSTGSVSIGSTHSNMNRGAWAAACFAPAGTFNYQMDQEAQFTGVYDSPTVIEELCIKTGSFGVTENLNVTYWDGDSWELITSSLTASAWNNFTVLVTSPTFTIKFGGSTTTIDNTQDWWEIDSILLMVEGPEEVLSEDSGFVWLDSPDEVALGTTYSSWIQQDLSDDSISSNATGVILVWVEDSLTDYHAVARGSQDTNDYMNGGSTYSEIEDESWRMQIVKLKDNKYVDTWRQSSTSRLYVMGYTVGSDPQFKRVASDLGSLTADSSWNKITVNGVNDSTTGVILFVQSTSSVDTSILVRAVGSTDSTTSREWEEYNSGVFFVEIDANDQFKYAINSGGSAKFFLIAEVKDSINWLDTNRDDISATIAGWTIRDLDSYVTVPLATSGVILQHESTGGLYDYKNIARRYGQSWTFPTYDVGGDQWLMGGSGIDTENRIQIYAESLEQDVYIHALTLYIDNTDPIIDSFGLDDPGTGTATFWANLIDDSEMDNVTLAVNGAEYQMSNNGSYWTKDLTVNWQEYYTYQITNASDIFGNFLVIPSAELNHTFSYDTVVPIVIDWEYYQGPDGTWDNQNNTFKANVSDSWGEIDTVLLEVTTHSLIAVMMEYQNFSGILGFINNTLDLPNEGINFRIIANDTNGNEITSSTHSDSVFYNHPPTAYDLTLSSYPYFSNTSLILTYEYSDEETHPEIGTEIRWYRNGLLQAAYNDLEQISADYLFDSDEWNATVRPKDNDLFGQINITSTVTIINTPPKITSVAIIPSNPYTTSTLIIDYDYYDYDTDGENVGYRQIEWYKDGTGHISGFDNQTSISSSNIVKGEEYYVMIRVYDGENYSIWFTSPSVLIADSIPIAVNLTLPSNPTNVTDLVANWDTVDDDAADTENTSAAIIYWYKNGVLQPLWTNSTEIGAENTSKGESWHFEIKVFAGDQYSALTELLPHVEILNSIPIAGNVTITTTNPYTTDDLVVGNWNFTDDDYDIEGSPIIHWYLNDNLQLAYNGYTTLPSSATSKDGYWHVGIQVFDGTAYSLEVNSSKVLISNSLPEVTDLTITLAPTTTNDLIASWTSNDNDLDSLTFNVTWYFDNVYNSSWLTTSNAATLNAGNTTKGDKWYYTVQATDGNNYSSIISLGYNVTIQNSLPTVTNPTFNDTSPEDGDNFNIIYGYVDADGDLENSGELIVYWYVNWVYQSQLQNYTVIYSQNTTQDEVWYFILRVFDGVDYSSNITSEIGVIIGGGVNFKPKAENLTLTPITPLTSDDLTAYYDYSDPENNNEIAFEILWYKNGILQPEYQSLTLPAIATAKDQQWNFTVRVFDGLQWSEVNSSLIFTIGNTAPETSGLGVISNPNPTTSDLLKVSWSSSDNDSDDLTFNVTWILNGVVNSSWITTDYFAELNAGNTTKGDKWNITIEAYDGDGGYSSIISLETNITIINTIPIAENLTLTLTPKTSDDLTVDWDYFDIDNDNENKSAAIIYWYKNGDLQPLWTNSTVIGAGNTSKDQSWWFTVKVYDNENFSSLYELSPHIQIQNTAPVNIAALPIPTDPTVASEVDISLSSVLSSLSDADGDSIELAEIRWYKDGILQVNLNDSLYISGSKLTKGEFWNYTIIPSDDVDYGIKYASPVFQILNSQPTITNPKFVETTDVRTIHNLSISYQTFDADDDPLSISAIYWYRYNSSSGLWDHIASYDGNISLPYSATQKDEIWRFNVSVTDLTDISDFVVPAIPVNIKNSLPWIDPYSIVITGGINTSDSLSLTYTWYDDDFPIDNDSGTGITWENSDLEFEPNNLLTLSSSFTKAGQSWWITITPNDGEEEGDPITSWHYGISIIIGNTPPEITSNEIKIQGYDSINGSYSDGVAFGTNIDLVVRYNVTDVDSGVFEYDVLLVDGYAFFSEYRWFRNRSNVVTLITALNGMTTVPSILTQRGDLWWIEITPRDNYGDFGTAINSTEISIANTAPYLTSFLWDKIEYHSVDDLAFEYIFADYDQSDVELGSIIEWYLNGVNLTDFSNYVSISSQNLTKGEIWSVRVRVWDGNLYSIWYQLSNITILNTAPIASDVLLTPLFPTASQNLTVSWDYLDYDNDSQQAPRIRWYKNYLLQSSFNDLDTIDASYLIKSDIWYATVEVFDGVNRSIMVISLSLTILNSPPTLTSVILWNNNDLSNASFSDGNIVLYYYNFTDPDLDLINTSAVFILWYHNGVYNSTYDNQSTIPSSELVKGDSWYAMVQVIDVDGVIWSNNITSQVITIINKPPDITLFEVTGTEFEEFVIEDENISISLMLNDPDAGDNDSSYIEWYVNAIYQPQFDGNRSISFTETFPGEIWSVNVIPSDGDDNGSVDTLVMLIESRPQIQNLSVEIEKDTDGHFIIGLQVTDPRNEIGSVQYELYLNGSQYDPVDNPDFANVAGFWIFEYYLTNSSFYDTKTILNVTAESAIGVTSTRTFNFTMIDQVAPRVSDEGRGVWFNKNPSINPTNLTFIAEIEEYGSSVTSVILNYYYGLVDDEGEGSVVSQDDYEVKQISMLFQSEEGGKMRYSVTIDTPSDDKDYEIIYWVSTTDSAGNSNEVAFDIRDDPDRIRNERISYQAPDISGIILLVAGLVIALIFIGAVVYVKFIRKPELIGLDKELVMKGVVDIVDDTVFENIDQHSLGVVVSFFDQRHGPVPIIVIPEMLKDNYDTLVALSDKSFSGTGFSEDFESEIPSSYDFVLGQQLRISVMSFGFALDRSEARGGKENLTINLLLQKEVFKLVSQFQDEIHKNVHEFHMLMAADSSDKSAIRMKANNVRKYVTKIILSYVEIYGTTELIEIEE